MNIRSSAILNKDKSVDLCNDANIEYIKDGQKYME